MSSVTKYPLRGMIAFFAIAEALLWMIHFSLKMHLEGNDERFRFENPDLLWALFLVPAYLIVSFLVLKWKNTRMARFADNRLMKHLTQPVSGFFTSVSIFLIRMSIYCLIIALANPQYGKGTRTAKSEGVDIIIALDVSNSMLANDVSGKWDRLKRSKLDIERLINKLGGDRLGLIVFAGVPIVQLPVTADLAASKFFLSGISTDMISIQGTDIGSAITLAMQSFPSDGKRQKAIIVVTDGEDHEEAAVLAAQNAKQQNMTVHTIGLGSVKGAPIPNYVNGEYQGMKRDADGNTVISRLNVKLLEQVAQAGGGVFVHATSDVSPLEIILAEIRKMEQTEVESLEYPEYEDRFQLFLIVSFLFLILELSLPNIALNVFENSNAND